jgi:DNA-binding NtrC family response regulator
MQEKILVADDDQPVRRMVGRVLESAGYLPLFANSGKDLILKLMIERPAVMLLDVKSPEAAGPAAFQQLREVFPLRTVIAMLAWDQRERYSLPRDIGAVLEKPLDLPLMLQTIKGLLEQRAREMVAGGKLRNAVA